MSEDRREHTTHHDDCGCLTARYEVELAAARAEVEEQARLLGMSGSREASLLAQVEAMRPVVEAAVAWQKCAPLKPGNIIAPARKLNAAINAYLATRKEQP